VPDFKRFLIHLSAPPSFDLLASSHPLAVGVISLEVKLALYRFGWGGIDASSLIESLSPVQIHLQWQQKPLSRAKKWRIIRAGGSLNVTLDFEMLAAWPRRERLSLIRTRLGPPVGY
jgi:hypothetical protein